GGKLGSRCLTRRGVLVEVDEDPHAAVGRRAGHQGAARPRRARVGRHDDGHRHHASAGDGELLRAGPVRRLLPRDEVDAAGRRGLAVLRSAAADLVDPVPDGDRSPGRDPRRPRGRHLPRGVRQPPHPEDLQAGRRDPRGHPDDRLRLLRPDVLHPAAAGHRRRRLDLQRAVGGDHPRHPRRAHDRVGLRGRTVLGPPGAPGGCLRPRRREMAGRRARRVPRGALRGGRRSGPGGVAGHRRDDPHPRGGRQQTEPGPRSDDRASEHGGLHREHGPVGHLGGRCRLRDDLRRRRHAVRHHLRVEPLRHPLRPQVPTGLRV
ncbi:MAG: Phosphate transport system permease protein PstC, partial [uncultured Solirubrobacteraceae bacterium]